jgi:hypothetical protein
MNILQFRKFLIEKLCESGILTENELGEGWVDWHDIEGHCGVSFVLKTGERYSLTIQ